MEIWYPGLINLGSFLPIYCAPLLQLSINRESASFLERKLVDPPPPIGQRIPAAASQSQWQHCQPHICLRTALFQGVEIHSLGGK